MDQILVPQPEQRRQPFRDMAAMRDALMSTRPDRLELVSNQPRGAEGERRLLTRAIEQMRAGLGFDFGRLELGEEVFAGGFGETSRAALEALRDGVLGLPYEVFISLTRLSIPDLTFDDFVLLTVEAEADRSLLVFPIRPMVNELGGTDFIPFPCSAQAKVFEDGSIGLQPAAYASEHDRPILELMLQLVFFQLGLLADDRVRLERETAPEKVNRARAARGRPSIPSRWKVAWVTKLAGRGSTDGAGRGGPHRSPIAHDRRGHQRRLPSGRLTWVRASRVGGLVKHMTRHRTFYEVATGDGQ